MTDRDQVLVIRRDDLTGQETRALIAHHLAGMQANSPPGSVNAVGTAALQGMEVWSAWMHGRIAGIAALKAIDDDSVELKSMRVADEFLGTGVGRALLRHLADEATIRGATSIYLETGRGPTFVPAQRLYASEGFELCERFGDYPASAFSVFMTKRLVGRDPAPW